MKYSYLRYRSNEGYSEINEQLVPRINADQVDREGEYFPPCISNVHKTLRRIHRLKHNDRFYYSLFLKSIGKLQNLSIIVNCLFNAHWDQDSLSSADNLNKAQSLYLFILHICNLVLPWSHILLFYAGHTTMYKWNVILYVSQLFLRKRRFMKKSLVQEKANNCYDNFPWLESSRFQA